MPGNWLTKLNELHHHCYSMQQEGLQQACSLYLAIESLLDVQATVDNGKQNKKDRAIPGSMDQHGGQQVSGAHIGEAQQGA